MTETPKRTRRTKALLERALLVVEGVVFNAANDHTAQPGEVPLGFTATEYIKMLQGMVSDCYCIAHAATGRCCGGGGGDPWLALIDKRAKELKKARITDVDKIQRAHK